MAKNNGGNTLDIFQKNAPQKIFTNKIMDFGVLKSIWIVKMSSEDLFAETSPPKFLWV